MEAEDAAAKTEMGAAKLLKCTVYITTHDPFKEYAALNLDELASDARQAGATKEAAAKALARPSAKPVPVYKMQSAITVKCRRLSPLGVGEQRAKALRTIEGAVDDALALTNWEVIRGKTHVARQKRRSEAGQRRAAQGGGVCCGHGRTARPTRWWTR